jgi:hypothetical protein
MASDRQTEANRINAQKCTGPRTAEGKARSSQNALKTGLDAKSEVIRFEKQSDYETLTIEYYTRFQPTVPEERCLVDTLIKSEWLGRRYMAVEANLWASQITDLFPHPLGRAFAMASEQFARVDRRINSAQRNFQHALKQLNQLRAQQLMDLTPSTEQIDPTVPSSDRNPTGEAAAESSESIQTPSPCTATNEPAAKLVSFPTPAPSAAPTPLQTSEPTQETPRNHPKKEHDPPIAA